MGDFDVARYAWTIRIARLRVPLGFVVAALTMWLARPTWLSLTAGASIAFVGAAIRIWAAGHLDKAHEVTMSGPYRLVRHPLYAGSSVIALGVVVAAADVAAAALAGGYLAVTLAAAIRLEEAWLRARFGDDYDGYITGRLTISPRRFSMARARANEEHLAVVGLLAGLAALVVKAWFAGR